MISKQHKAIVYTYFGRRSVFSKVYKAADFLDEGTKVLLLQRAMKQDKAEFTKTLDHLYSKLKESTLKTNKSLLKNILIIIHGLQLLNDVLRNSTLDYLTDKETGKTTCALEAVFGTKQINCENFLVDLVQWHISKLLTTRDQILSQKSSYQQAEPTHVANSEWRISPGRPHEIQVMQALKDKVVYESIFAPLEFATKAQKDRFFKLKIGTGAVVTPVDSAPSSLEPIGESYDGEMIVRF